MWLRWASPLGWVDELRPLTGSRPLLLLPIAGFTAVLAAAAVILAGRRDLGASVLPAGDTAVPRIRLLNSPLGLAARLARRSALSWLGGLAVGGLILGLTAEGTETVFSSQSGGVLQKHAVVAWSFLVEIIGASLGASCWLLDTSILHHSARAPAAGVRWDSAAILVAIGIAAAVAGAAAFARPASVPAEDSASSLITAVLRAAFARTGAGDPARSA